MGLTSNAIFHDDVSDASSDYTDSNVSHSSFSGDSSAKLKKTKTGKINNQLH